MTGNQLRSLLNGSVLGASSPAPEEAAGVPEAAAHEAPSGSSAPANGDADDISSTTPSEAIEDPAPDPEPLDVTQLVDVPPAPEPAGDNTPVVDGASELEQLGSPSTVADKPPFLTPTPTGTE